MTIIKTTQLKKQMSGNAKLIDITGLMYERENEKENVVYVKIISKNDLGDIVYSIMRTLSINYKISEDIISQSIIFCDEEDQMDIRDILSGHVYVPISKKIIDEYKSLSKIINDAAKTLEMFPDSRHPEVILETYKSYLADLLNENFAEKIRSINAIRYSPMLSLKQSLFDKLAENESDASVMFMCHIIHLIYAHGVSEFSHYKPIDDISRIRHGDALKGLIATYNTLVRISH